MSRNNVNRRDFLKLTAVGAAVVAGTRIIRGAGASSSAPKGKQQ